MLPIFDPGLSFIKYSSVVLLKFHESVIYFLLGPLRRCILAKVTKLRRNAFVCLVRVVTMLPSTGIIRLHHHRHFSLLNAPHLASCSFVTTEFRPLPPPPRIGSASTRSPPTPSLKFLAAAPPLITSVAVTPPEIINSMRLTPWKRENSCYRGAVLRL